MAKPMPWLAPPTMAVLPVTPRSMSASQERREEPFGVAVEHALECLARESFLVYWSPQAVWWDPRLDLLRDDKRFVRVLERVAQVWSPEWS